MSHARKTVRKVQQFIAFAGKAAEEDRRSGCSRSYCSTSPGLTGAAGQHSRPSLDVSRTVRFTAVDAPKIHFHDRLFVRVHRIHRHGDIRRHPPRRLPHVDASNRSRAPARGGGAVPWIDCWPNGRRGFPDEQLIKMKSRLRALRGADDAEARMATRRRNGLRKLLARCTRQTSRNLHV